MLPQMIKSQQDIISELGMKKFLGRLYWVGFHTTDRWERDRFEQAMDDAGLTEDRAPKLCDSDVFVRALRWFEKNARDKLVRKIKELSSHNFVVFQVTREFVSEIGVDDYELDYHNEGKVEFDKFNKEINCANVDILNAIKAHLVTEEGTYRGDDLRRMYQRIMEKDAHAFMLRSGVYFVPEEYADWCDRITTFFDKLGIDMTEVGCFPIVNLDGVRKQCEQAYFLHAKKCIEEINDEIEDMTEKGKDKKGGIPAAVLQRKLAKIHELKGRVAFFQQALSIETDEIQRAMKDTERSLYSAMMPSL